MINVVCGIRSTGRICTDLARALEEQGHEVKIAYGRENAPQEFQNYAVRIGTDLDIMMHGLRARLFDGCGFGSRKATQRFVEWIKSYDPDVIHLHNLHGYYINLEELFNYLRTCGKKIIWTLHDCWAFTGHSAYCDTVNCDRWINGCHDCPIMNYYPASFIDNSPKNWIKKQQLFRNIPRLTIVTPSNWLAGLVKKSFLSEYTVRTISNGIDTKHFRPLESDLRACFGLGNKKILLGVATAWDDMKGLSDFYRLSSMLDNEKYQIVLVGLTQKQIKKLPSTIIGIKKTNSIKELASIYSAADVFLNLSYCENYPTVNLEAIACGTPVLTYDTGGSSESAFGENVVQRGNLDEVYKVIENFEISMPTVDVADLDYKRSIDSYLKELYMRN
ncbi:glycosyltransferase [Butyrivibrio sp. X503]|uniref:glycosyltransferase n=1 Tax=Butyrivibrio sp. X503 TaxID=2364878 RepID=UPI001FA9E80F|nr:glycosyltransferase [Butyrivibrio sp. X503]